MRKKVKSKKGRHREKACLSFLYGFHPHSRQIFNMPILIREYRRCEQNVRLVQVCLLSAAFLLESTCGK